MSVSRNDLPHQLEDAANRFSDVPRRETKALLRRAALRLRNTDRPAVTLYDEYRSLIDALNAPFGDLGLELDDAAWLEANACLRVREPNEDGEVTGNA